jgi:transketolase
VLYPCDGNQTARLVAAMADLSGISYIRTTREKTPRLYEADGDFPVGGSVVHGAGTSDRVAIVGAGVTVFQALEAAEALEAEGIPARVIDCYSIKPIDGATLRAALVDTGLVVTVEDHWPEGGLGDAVLAALADGGPLTGRVHKVAVEGMPGSGTPEELREWAGISSARIAEAVRGLLA